MLLCTYKHNEGNGKMGFTVTVEMIETGLIIRRSSEEAFAIFVSLLAEHTTPQWPTSAIAEFATRVEMAYEAQLTATVEAIQAAAMPDAGKPKYCGAPGEWRISDNPNDPDAPVRSLCVKRTGHIGPHSWDR